MMLLWAALVGCLGGLSAIAFREAIQGVLWLWTQHTGNIGEVAAKLAWWQRLWIPAAGGLLAGLVLHFGARFGRGDRSTDYMEAVAVSRGALSVRRSLAKTGSSLLTIGSGGSIGREGAMVQLSAMLASWFGESIRLSTPRLRLMIACGAAGGIAAVYDVTVAAALFVAEILLGSIAVESLGPLLMASFASSLVSRFLGKTEVYFTSPPFELHSPWELGRYALMAILLGLAAPGYVWLLRRAEGWLARLVAPLYWRMALGGLIVGVLAVQYHQVWGNGRSAVNTVLTQRWPMGLLVGVLLCKVVATAATTGSGAVGGVFTPTMFTGAMTGLVIGQSIESLWPSHIAAAQYALLGMGGFLAAATRAPLMAIMMVSEMTMDYGMILPVMAVCLLAYYVARALQNDSIYSESLRRKQAHTAPAELAGLCVRDIMRPVQAKVGADASLAEIMKLLIGAPYRHLPVVTARNELQGIVTLADIEKRLAGFTEPEQMKAAEVMRTRIRKVARSNTLAEAWEVFRGHSGERLPVVNSFHDRILAGYITRTDLLLTMAHGLKGTTESQPPDEKPG
jgi:chloride channel protein, CIC family